MIHFIDKTHLEKCKSWSETKDMLNSLSNDNYSFRGHKFSTWKLISSFERNFQELTFNSLKDYYMLAFEKMNESNLFQNISHSSFYEANEIYFKYNGLITQYYKEIKPFQNPSNFEQFVKVGELFALFYKVVLILQHHNIPTHLIDISQSFYVAAYFALFHTTDKIDIDNSENYPVVIATQWNYNPSDIIARGITKDKRRRIKHQSFHHRIASQQGTFIDTYSEVEYKIYRFTIKPVWIPEIFEDLKMMYINGFSLFRTTEALGTDFFYNVKYANLFS